MVGNLESRGEWEVILSLRLTRRGLRGFSGPGVQRKFSRATTVVVVRRRRSSVGFATGPLVISRLERLQVRRGCQCIKQTSLTQPYT